MKFGNSLIAQIKNLGRRSQLLSRWYWWFRVFNIVSNKKLWSLISDIRKTRLILTVRPYTILGFTRMSLLYELARRFERAKISGSFVECGVRNGGSAAIMAAVAKHNLNRQVWLFDSWEGFPEPDERDITFGLQKAEKGGALGSEGEVKEILFSRLHLDNTRVHLVKGWFEDTLPRNNIGTISLVHLDCDLYESIKFCLEQLYDHVIKGGCIVIDDYAYFKGCKEAVDEFIKHRNLKAELIQVDLAAYFYKEA